MNLEHIIPKREERHDHGTEDYCCGFADGKNAAISEMEKNLRSEDWSGWVRIEDVVAAGFIIGRREGDAFKEYDWKEIASLPRPQGEEPLNK